MAAKTKKVKNFIGRGVADNSSGLIPNEHTGMGFYYGRAHKNPMGKLRSDTLGYIPVSRKQLGTSPTSLA